MEQIKRNPNCIEYFETEQEIKKREAEETTIEKINALETENTLLKAQAEINTGAIDFMIMNF